MQCYPYVYSSPIIPAPYNLRTETVSLDYIVLLWNFNFDFDIEYGGDFDYANYLSGFEVRQVQLNADMPKPPPTFLFLIPPVFLSETLNQEPFFTSLSSR
ncbi:hypothetical protein ABK905_15255 [Acerihabitans sp. KWT182]|uniref:Uncharacterized protein n=1 Tax=Acerihabitans sp. KWT182 TaxID=3157919 RepID=A0AAU7Q7H5_9GAMM